MPILAGLAAVAYALSKGGGGTVCSAADTSLCGRAVGACMRTESMSVRRSTGVARRRQFPSGTDGPVCRRGHCLRALGAFLCSSHRTGMAARETGWRGLFVAVACIVVPPGLRCRWRSGRPGASPPTGRRLRRPMSCRARSCVSAPRARLALQNDWVQSAYASSSSIRGHLLSRQAAGGRVSLRKVGCTAGRA